jgi:hypothetical protein
VYLNLTPGGWNSSLDTCIPLGSGGVGGTHPGGDADRMRPAGAGGVPANRLHLHRLPHQDMVVCAASQTSILRLRKSIMRMMGCISTPPPCHCLLGATLRRSVYHALTEFDTKHTIPSGGVIRGVYQYHGTTTRLSPNCYRTTTQLPFA